MLESDQLFLRLLESDQLIHQTRHRPDLDIVLLAAHLGCSVFNRVSNPGFSWETISTLNDTKEEEINNSLKRIIDKSNLMESPTKHTRRTRGDKDSTEASSLERWR